MTPPEMEEEPKKRTSRRRHRLTPIQPSKWKENGPQFVARHGSGKDRREPTFHKEADGLAYLDSIKEAPDTLRPDEGLFPFAKRHLKLISKDMARGTVDGFKRQTAVVCEVLAGRTLKSIDVATLVEVREQLKNYAPTTARLSDSMLRRILDLATKSRIIASNPYDDLPGPRVPRIMSPLLPLSPSVMMPIPSADVFEQLVAHLSPGPGRTLVLLALLSGLRIGEILALRWKNVHRPDHGEWMIDVVTTYSSIDENGVVKTHTSNRLIPVVEKLKAHLAMLAPKGKDRSRDEEYVCRQQRNGEGFIYETARIRMKEFQVEAGVGSMTQYRDEKGVLKRRYEGVCGAHELRHACAAYWIYKGVDDLSISEWLGHRDDVFTMDVYGYLFADRGNGSTTWPTVIPTIKGGLHA